MQISQILEAIDSEISRLQSARALLVHGSDVAEPAKRRGRPKGSTNGPKVSAPISIKPAKKATRTMSEEGKARIAAAQKARWAAAKKAAAPAKKTVAKKSVKRASTKAAAKKRTAAEATAAEPTTTESTS